MNVKLEDLLQSVEKDAERRASTQERLLSAADSSRVFGQAVVHGEYAVIPVANVTAAGGFGSGLGFGPATKKGVLTPGEEVSKAEDGQSRRPQPGGAGGGGGGASRGRPVAVIVIGPDGVEIKRIVDATKVAFVAVATWGAVVLLAVKMARKRSDKETSAPSLG